MKQEVNSPLIITIGVVSGLMLIVIMFGVEAWFKYEEKQELALKWQASHNSQLDTLRADQRGHLEESRWCDATKTTVTIPVGDAMRLLAAANGKMPSTQPGSQPVGLPIAQ